METNNYAADIGNVAGGVISNVIKSGSNSFHGNAFEFYRTTGLNANSWANNRSGAKRPELTQHIFGATFGGPIIKNKLFFFVDYQGTVRDQPGQTTASVAPAAWRQGDLSSITTKVIDPLTGQAFPNNQIPLSRISPTALAILNDPNYPLPNREVTGITGNYVGDTLTTTRAHQGDIRLDCNALGSGFTSSNASAIVYNDGSDGRPVMYGTWGWGGQHGLVVPGLGLVAVFTGWNVYDEVKAEYAFRLFYDRIVAGIAP